jgi:zinc/manganese transport system substrate-binding protein
MLRSIIGVVAFAVVAAVARAEPVRVVAAESVYGDICRQIGGDAVEVTSILANPQRDPHAFDAGASTARAIAQARLVVWNGAGYDDWMEKLLRASRLPARETIEVARLAHRKAGDNPHVWYDVRAISALSKTIAETLSRIDPAHRGAYEQRLAAFETSMRAVSNRIEAIRAKHAGVPITATEPVFDYMVDALGLVMRNRRLQLAVMNGTEPAAKDIAAFEHDLRARAVRALVYNTQSGGTLAQRLRAIAEASGVPVVEVTETQPAGTTYQRWMVDRLDALERALSAR